MPERIKTTEVGLLYKVGAATVERVHPANKKTFQLSELQSYVGGYIELVPFAKPLAYCNEEGRLRGLPLNKLASVTFSQSLVGDVIQVTKEKDSL